MQHRKPLIIAAIAGTLAVILGVTGWTIYTTVQLSDARAAYEAAVTELESAQSDAAAEADALTGVTQTVVGGLETAEQLVPLLGEGTETLLAAAEGTRTIRERVDGDRATTAPARSAGTLPENPTVDDYVTLRDAVETLTAAWRSYADDLAADAQTITTDGESLATLWRAQIDMAADGAAAAITASPNASQEAKDAATAAAAALTELTDPLAPESVELWAALLTANTTLAAQEQAYQEQRAAEAEAARRAAQASRPPSGGGSSGGRTNPGSGPGGVTTLEDVERALANQLGIDPGVVNCYDIPNGIRCEYPGGSRTVTI